MNEPPDTEPRDVPPARPPGGSRVLGIVIGIVYLAAAAALGFLSRSQASQITGGVLLLGFFAVGIALTSNPRTTRVGAGLMISLGIALVVGAGVCFAVMSRVGAPS